MRCLAAVPIYHIYGFNMNVSVNHVFGGTIILVPQPSVDNVLAAINQHEPNIFPAVPTMIIGPNQHPDIKTSKIGSVKGVISGSAPLPVEAMRTFEELSGAVITEGYGMSETSNIVTANPCTPCASRAAWDRFPTTMFGSSTSKPEPSICRWASRASSSARAHGDGVLEQPGGDGEDAARRWLYTGDIAYLDTDGHVFIVDRKKDMILSSGFNVYPARSTN